MMISRPLLKQSVKANFTRWIIVTFASCFIVAVVILILGNLNVNKIRGSLEDLFEDSDKQAEIQYESVDNYQKVYDVYNGALDKYKEYDDILERAIAGTATEDEYADFSEEFIDAIEKIRNGESKIASSKTQISSGEKQLASSKSQYDSSKTEADIQKGSLISKQEQLSTGIAKSQAELQDLKSKLEQVNSGIEQVNSGLAQVKAGYVQIEAAQSSSGTVNPEEMTAEQLAILSAQKTALEAKKAELDQTKAGLEAKLQELNGQKAQLEAGIAQYESGLAEAQSNLEKVNGGISTIDSKLAEGQSQISSAQQTISSSKTKLTSAENELESSKEELRTKTREALLDKIADGVYDEAIKENDEETSEKSKNMAKEVIEKYQNGEITDNESVKRLAKNYVANSVYDEAIKENSEEDSSLAKEIASTAIDEYNNKVESGTSEEDALNSISRSLIDQLPDDVEDAILEIKDLDVYGLVVGNILFRIAGLLLPMIFVIMTANGLLAGQVDSGSMAYILSTPTKRSKVTITQMIYLMLSVLLMYVCVGVTSVICMKIIKDSEITITIEEMVKFNIGAFFVMLAVSGICYLSSAIFNREKNSISVGGGITMFFLVCSILGLFGEDVIPSAIRIDAMNYFNYASIISLFNVHSMLNGTNDYIGGLLILLVIALVTYFIGIIKFDRKDLPL